MVEQKTYTTYQQLEILAKELKEKSITLPEGFMIYVDCLDMDTCDLVPTVFTHLNMISSFPLKVEGIDFFIRSYAN